RLRRAGCAAVAPWASSCWRPEQVDWRAAQAGLAQRLSIICASLDNANGHIPMNQIQANSSPMRGKSVLITGATSGIGEQLAHRFAAMGATPILVARSLAKLDQLGGKLTALYGCAPLLIVADLADDGAAQTIFAATSAQHLTVDVLVNNAGQGRFGEFTAN